MYINIIVEGVNTYFQIINSSDGAQLAYINSPTFPQPTSDISSYYMTCSPDGNLYLFYSAIISGNLTPLCMQIATGIAVVNDVIVFAGDYGCTET